MHLHMDLAWNILVWACKGSLFTPPRPSTIKSKSAVLELESDTLIWWWPDLTLPRALILNLGDLVCPTGTTSSAGSNTIPGAEGLSVRGCPIGAVSKIKLMGLLALPPFFNKTSFLDKVTEVGAAWPIDTQIHIAT